MTFDLQKFFESKHALCRPLAARHAFSLSASILFSASDGEKAADLSAGALAKAEGRMRCLRESGERDRMRCRNFGFNGPIMVEGVKVGATAEETTANARRIGSFWKEY